MFNHDMNVTNSIVGIILLPLIIIGSFLLFASSYIRDEKVSEIPEINQASKTGFKACLKVVIVVCLLVAYSLQKSSTKNTEIET